MNLWLDNVRTPPNNRPWVWVKTVEEAQHYLKTGRVQLASLDHDLDESSTGMTLLDWMKSSGHWPHYQPRVHSGNVEAALKMKAFIADHAGHRPVYDMQKATSGRSTAKLSTGGSSRYHPRRPLHG